MVPIKIIHSTKNNNAIDSCEVKYSSRLFTLLNYNNCAETYQGKINDREVLVAFFEDALEQIQQFIENNLKSFNAPNEIPILSPSRITLILQVFHSLGVMLGIAIRSNIPIILKLPSEFHELLVCKSPNEYLSDENINQIQLQTMALSLRRGITSIIPNSVLEWMRVDDIKYLLRGCPTLSCATFLRRNATYEVGVNSTDKHVALFWSAIRDLPHKQRLELLCHLWKKSQHVTFDILCAQLEESDASIPSIHIFPPTALAMLCSDTSPIVIFPDRSAISLPRYTSFFTMKSRLKDLITSLKLNDV
jgi:hypothetical protein